MGEIEAVLAAAAPAPLTTGLGPTTGPMQRVSGCPTATASHSQPDAVQATSPSRHRPGAQLDADRGPASLDHKARGGPGKLHGKGSGWGFPFQDDALTEPGDSFEGQAWGIADEVAILECGSA